jgi:hypothetical protein
VGVDRDTCVKAETLYAGATLSGDELDILCFDPIPKSHYRLARAGPRCDAVSQ